MDQKRGDFVAAAPVGRIDLGVARLERYTALAQALHWLTALLIFTILPLGWIMVQLARDNP